MKKSGTLRLIGALALLSACSPNEQWEERWPSVTYHFRGDDKAFVSFNCFGPPEGPILGLIGGDYPSGSDNFQLSVDGQTRSIAAFRGTHGRALLIDDQKIIAAFATAKHEITFRVGEHWARNVPPDPRLERFRQRCLTPKGQR